MDAGTHAGIGRLLRVSALLQRVCCYDAPKHPHFMVWLDSLGVVDLWGYQDWVQCIRSRPQHDPLTIASLNMVDMLTSHRLLSLSSSKSYSSSASRGPVTKKRQGLELADVEICQSPRSRHAPPRLYVTLPKERGVNQISQVSQPAETYSKL